MDENKEFGMERDVLQPEEMTAPVISETEDAQTESRVEENTEPHEDRPSGRYGQAPEPEEAADRPLRLCSRRDYRGGAQILQAF